MRDPATRDVTARAASDLVAIECDEAAAGAEERAESPQTDVELLSLESDIREEEEEENKPDSDDELLGAGEHLDNEPEDPLIDNDDIDRVEVAETQPARNPETGSDMISLEEVTTSTNES